MPVGRWLSHGVPAAGRPDTPGIPAGSWFSVVPRVGRLFCCHRSPDVPRRERSPHRATTESSELPDALNGLLGVQATTLPNTTAIGYDSRMLKPIPYCECGQPATRFVPDRYLHRGRQVMLALCPHCPSPAEIDERAALVRESWSDEEHYCKHYGCSRAGLEYLQAVDLRDHQVTTGCVDGRVMRAAD